MSSALDGALLEVKFGALAEFVLVFVDSTTREVFFFFLRSKTEELACGDAGCPRSAPSLPVCTMRTFFESDTDIEAILIQHPI